MPADLEEQIPWVHQACAALGVPVLTHEGFEADDVIGTLAVRGAAAGFDVAIVTGDKDFFQLVGGRIRVFNPRDDGTWYDAAGVVREVRRAAGEGGRRAVADGRRGGQRQGRAGHRREGRARTARRSSGRWTRCSRGADTVPQKRYREALLANADAARASRVLVTIRTDVPVDLDLAAFRYRGAGARARATSCSRSSGSASLTNEFAPTAADRTASERDYAASSELASRRTLVDRALVADRGRGRSRRVGLRVIGDDPNPMRARIVRHRAVGAARAAGVLRAARAPRARRVVNLDQAAVLAALTAAGRRRGRREGRPRREVRRHRAGRHGVRGGRARLRHDAGQLPDRLDPRAACPRGPEPRRISATRPLTEEGVCGKGAKATAAADLPAAGRARLRGRAGRPAAAAGDACCATRLRPRGWTRCTGRWSGRWCRCCCPRAGGRARWTPPRSAALSQALEARDGRAAARSIFELAGETFNINSPKQLGDILFEKLKLPVLKKTGTTKAASTAVDVLEELALIARAAAPHPRLARRCRS